MEPSRILVVLPNWVGDVVMATPALRALRNHFAPAHIVLLVQDYLADLLTGTDWADELIFWPGGKSRSLRNHGFLRLAGRLRRQHFDLAVLLANSFRAAMLTFLAGARRRVGYDREGRGLLLTDRLTPKRVNGQFAPVPMVRYYNDLVKHLGAQKLHDKPQLPVSTDHHCSIERWLERHGVTSSQPLVVINPGASFGSSKCWLPERFAQLADRLAETFAARVIVNCGPDEQDIGRAITKSIRHDGVVLADEPLSLGQLMSLVRRCDLLITNDTGPRHFAVAYGVPVVTIFGPTDPRWSETGYQLERKLIVPVDCGPCMKPTCPLDHKCMTQINVEMVLQAAGELLGSRSEVKAVQ